MKTAAIGLGALCLMALSPSAIARQDNKDIVKRTYTVKGVFIGFEVGDYVHALIKDSKGEQRAFFIGGQGVDYFLAVNAKKQAVFTCQSVNSFIEESGQRENIERIWSVKIGKVTSEQWWKAQRKKATLEQLAKKYDPMVEKLIFNP